MSAEPVFLGIDLGTSGVRSLIATPEGRVVARSGVALPTAAATGSGLHEQNPADWWSAVRRSLAEVLDAMQQQRVSVDRIRGLCVDGTSGTVAALEPNGRPLRPAIMYNDSRCCAEAESLNQAAGPWCAQAGIRFDASFALPKLAWIQRHEPALFDRTDRFVHQTDFIVGQLTGDSGVTDYTNALKTGYDLVADGWPRWLMAMSGIAERLPTVTAPGTQIGEVSVPAAEATGLPVGLPVVAGATDGVAAAVASGLRRVGDFNTTLGTTLVFKGLSSTPICHPQGLTYAHKLPGELWLPGAASNTGAAWIGAWFPQTPPQELDERARGDLPSKGLAYPLVGRGERFPFRCPVAAGFFIPETVAPDGRYAACLTGTALVERLGYEVLDGLSGCSGGAIYSTGGASSSDIWMQCRADVTGRVLHRPQVAESALGSAILAAAGTMFESLEEASRAMTRVERTFFPASDARKLSDELFGRFRDELSRRGYLEDSQQKTLSGQ